MLCIYPFLKSSYISYLIFLYLYIDILVTSTFFSAYPLDLKLSLKTVVTSQSQYISTNLVRPIRSIMGLSPYPNPVDAGVLCIILVNTAKSISTVKEIVWYILHAIGIQVVSWEEYSTASPANLSGSREICLGTSIEEFRSRIPAVNYDSLCSHKQLEHECSVCLTEFKPEAVINHLSCGHVFHKSCLEKWLKYRNITCPNCRKHMISAEDEEDTCPM